MPDFNQVILVGNVTRDIEVRYLASNTAVCDISLAINHKWFDKAANQKREEVSFIDCTAFGRTAEIAGEYLAKGKPVLISGRLKQESWEDKQSGQKRSKIKVVVETLQLLGSGQPRGEERQSHPPEVSQEQPVDPENVPW